MNDKGHLLREVSLVISPGALWVGVKLHAAAQVDIPLCPERIIILLMSHRIRAGPASQGWGLRVEETHCVHLQRGGLSDDCGLLGYPGLPEEGGWETVEH